MAGRTVGMIGGLGPDATVDLFGRVVRATPARTDQEHLRILIDNHPQIPGRVAAILEGGPSPVPAMVESARLLERAGADFLVVPCNTAHYFLPEVQAAVSIPFLNLIDEVVTWLRRQPRPVRRAGLMASTGARQIELYQKPLLAAGIEPVLPPEREQQLLMDAIFGLKAGRPRSELREMALQVLDSLLLQGVDAAISGCTELPLMLDPADVPVLYADGNTILAEATVRFALSGE